MSGSKHRRHHFGHWNDDVVIRNAELERSLAVFFFFFDVVFQIVALRDRSSESRLKIARISDGNCVHAGTMTAKAVTETRFANKL